MRVCGRSRRPWLSGGTGAVMACSGRPTPEWRGLGTGSEGQYGVGVGL